LRKTSIVLASLASPPIIALHLENRIAAALLSECCQMGARDIMQNQNLTDRTLKALAKRPAPKADTYDIMDTVVPGFGVRMSETGRRTFILHT
jgi:hypothetical protein